MPLSELIRWLRVTKQKGYIRNGSLMIKRKDLEQLQKPNALSQHNKLVLHALTSVEGLVTVEG